MFKTKGVGQKILAAATGVPVSVMETAGEGGAWGIALLAAFMSNRNEETLADYLSKHVFANSAFEEVEPDEEDAKGFDIFMKRYVKGLEIERAAVKNL